MNGLLDVLANITKVSLLPALASDRCYLQRLAGL